MRGRAKREREREQKRMSEAKQAGEALALAHFDCLSLTCTHTLPAVRLSVPECTHCREESHPPLLSTAEESERSR